MNENILAHLKDQVKLKFKSVNYLGLDITIPSDELYVASDNDGEIFSYSICPVIDFERDLWEIPYNSGFPQEMTHVLNIDKNVLPKDFDWKESLVSYVPELPKDEVILEEFKEALYQNESSTFNEGNKIVENIVDKYGHTSDQQNKLHSILDPALVDWDDNNFSEEWEG